MIRKYKVVFSNGVETSITARATIGMMTKVWEVWKAFWWREESVVVECEGRRWVGEWREKSGYPKWKEVK